MMIPLVVAGMAALGGQDPDPAGGLGGRSESVVERVPFDASKWRLAWRDEFDAGSAPDPKFWGYEEGYIRNGEAQYYTKDRRENARIEDGRLVIEARRDNWQDRPITSASVTTRGKRAFLYGRIEVRAKVPAGRGTWPAIWTLGENRGEVGWPKCGELDIMEYVGFDPETIHANVHVGAYNHAQGNGKGSRIPTPTAATRFHVYALEWYRDRVEFYRDDQRYFVFRNEGTGEAAWPFDKPQYLILNLAIGGAWGGQRGIDETLFPHRFEVDYVRYYERIGDAG